MGMKMDKGESIGRESLRGKIIRLVLGFLNLIFQDDMNGAIFYIQDKGNLRSGFIGERLLPPIRVIFTNTEECVKLVQETKATLDMSSRKRFNTGDLVIQKLKKGLEGQKGQKSGGLQGTRELNDMLPQLQSHLLPFLPLKSLKAIDYRLGC